MLETAAEEFGLPLWGIRCIQGSSELGGKGRMDGLAVLAGEQGGGWHEKGGIAG